MAIKEVSKAEFLALFDLSVHDKIEQSIVLNRAVAVVCFENPTMDSSAFGSRTALCVGPGCTYKTPEEVDGKWLNDLPSQRQYPTAFFRVV